MDLLNIASKGKVVQLTDGQGAKDIFIKIPKFKISDVIVGGSNTTHPAFIVNGVEKDAIYIAKYMASYDDRKRCVSIPFSTPIDNLTYQDAFIKSYSKGNGYHLMTIAEWSALILYCYKNNYIPLGNNGNGICNEDNSVIGMPTTTNSKVWYTGTGGKKCNSDLTSDGVNDVAGNISSFVSGVRNKNCEIQVTLNNDIALNPNAEYKALDINGNRVNEGTVNALGYRGGGITNDGTKTQINSPFALLYNFTGNTLPEVLISLTLYPQPSQVNNDDTLRSDSFQNPNDYYYPSVGGNFMQGISSGIFWKYFNREGFKTAGYGFRFAYVQP